MIVACGAAYIGVGMTGLMLHLGWVEAEPAWSMIASTGRTPEWFATTRAAPVAGTWSRPRIRIRNHCRYRASATGMRTAELSSESNPNGSTSAIAGVANVAGNVVGLMPHPERASDQLLGSDDGNVLLSSFLDAAARYASSRS